MPPRVKSPPLKPPRLEPLRSRLGWFVALWAAGVAAVGLAGLAIRLVLH